MKKRTIRVSMLEHHAMVAGYFEIFNTAIGMRSVKWAQTAAELFNNLKDPENVPDVLLINALTYPVTGAEVVRLLKKEYPAIKTIGITYCSSNMHKIEMIRAGAFDAIDSDSREEDVIEAVRKVYHHPEYFINLYHNRERILTEEEQSFKSQFSDKEIEFLQLTSKCLKEVEVSELMGISIDEAEHYESVISDKLGAHIRADMVVFAVRRGLIQL